MAVDMTLMLAPIARYYLVVNPRNAKTALMRRTSGIALVTDD